MKASPFSRWIILGFVCLMIGLFSLTAPRFSTRELFAYILVYIAAFFFAIFIHELGHLIAGTLIKFRFSVFAVGPLAIIKTDNGLKLGRPQNRSFLGYNLFFPTDTANIRKPMIILLAGGPIASIVLLIISYLVMTAQAQIAVNFVRTLPMWIVVSFVQATFYCSIFLVITNLLPFPQLLSDGSKLVKLLAGGATTDRWLAVTLISFESLKGIRPKAWSADLIDRLTANQDISADAASAHSLAYTWAIDRGDLKTAGKYLIQIVRSRKKVVRASQAAIIAEAAFYELFYRNDQEQAAGWLKQLRASYRYLPLISRLQLEAALALASGDKDKAGKLAHKGIASLEQSTDGASQSQVMVFRSILAKCEPEPPTAAKTEERVEN